MRWLRRNRPSDPPAPAVCLVKRPGQQDASAAVQRAKLAHLEAQTLGREIAQMNRALRQLRTQNHFAASIAELWSGGDRE